MGALAQQLQDRAPKIVNPNDAVITILDIERFPGAFTAQKAGLTISGEFWDLSQYKRYGLGRRIQPDEVTRWPRTICMAWKRYGRRKVEFAAEWSEPNYESFVGRLWEVIDQSDVIIGHNIRAFDHKHLRSMFALHGMMEPTPCKIVDTLLTARREFGLESNTLDSLCQRFGIPAKTDKYDIEVARAALDGDVKMQRKLERYNKGDIAASEGLADVLRPWDRTHPIIGTFGDDKACVHCGSQDLHLLEGKRQRAVVLDYALFRCESCGGLNKPTHAVARAANMRGVTF